MRYTQNLPTAAIGIPAPKPLITTGINHQSPKIVPDGSAAAGAWGRGMDALAAGGACARSAVTRGPHLDMSPPYAGTPRTNMNVSHKLRIEQRRVQELQSSLSCAVMELASK